MLLKKTLINFYPFQSLLNQFRAKELKKYQVSLQMKTKRNKRASLIHFKDINFISKDLQLTEKDKEVE